MKMILNMQSLYSDMIYNDIMKSMICLLSDKSYITLDYTQNSYEFKLRENAGDRSHYQSLTGMEASVNKTGTISM